MMIKISVRSGFAAAAALLVHAIIIALFIAGLSEHKTDVETTPPVIVRLIETSRAIAPAQPKQPPPPKPAAPPPQRPAPAPAPVQPAPSLPVPQAAEPKPAAPPAAHVAPASPPPKSEPAPAPVTVAPPAPPAASKTDVSISASYSASNIKPTYPSMSKRLNEQGTVVLRVLVKSDGSAGAVEVKSSSSYPRLDQAAVEAVKTWRFNPATSDGKPIDEWYQVPIPFKLQASSN